MGVTHKPGNYHHGQLRRALLDAALQLVETRGINGFTLREVARQAGVSHAAPYHHFSDKSGLVEALVIESFDRFAEALRTAETTTSGSAVARLTAVGLAYVRFALEQGAAFRLMFRPELRMHTQPADEQPSSAPVEHAGLAAYQILIDCVVACQAEGSMPMGDPNPLALTAWCTVHGLALLILDGTLRSKSINLGSPDQLAETITSILAVGMLTR